MWLLRDCGSPVGTHVNGDQIQAIILNHGDEVQLGTFSFTTHFPEHAAPTGAPPSAPPSEPLSAPPSEPPASKRSIDRSRRNLVNLALKLRRRLHDAQTRIAETPAAPMPAPAQAQVPAEIVQQTEAIEAKIREYELRVCRLEEAERELAVDRDALNEAYACLAAKVERSERDLARRKEESELEIKKAWDQLKERCHGLLRDTASPSKPNPPEEPGPEAAQEIERLKLRKNELDAFAAHLRQERLRIRDREMQLAVERVRLAQLAQAQSQNREHPRKDETAAPRKPVFLTRPSTSSTAASS